MTTATVLLKGRVTAVAKQDLTALNDLIACALSGGERPSDVEIREATPTAGNAHDSQNLRRKTKILLIKIGEAAAEGQRAKADDLVSDLLFEVDPAAQKATKDELTDKIDRMTPTPSTQARQAAGQIRGAAKAQIQGLLDKAAQGGEVSDDEINALAVAEDVSDAQLGLFKVELRAAVEDVRTRRGDLEQRDGRAQREQDAGYAANRHLSELMSEGVVTAPGQDWESLPNDPAQLADLIGR